MPTLPERSQRLLWLHDFHKGQFQRLRFQDFGGHPKAAKEIRFVDFYDPRQIRITGIFLLDHLQFPPVDLCSFAGLGMEFQEYFGLATWENLNVRDSDQVLIPEF
ncbi:hypothetical protein [Ruegeria arenilitoris]|uniref:hypothetical protein n=1 Tax=Ruegeria arenilitoris TaxID=1173585 RepID=UPI00147AA855|nr:hypothetical protein [Ruegeria arenilitoris]